MEVISNEQNIINNIQKKKKKNEINGLFYSSNFLKTFISLMKHRKCKVCLPLFSHRMPDRCCSNGFTFLTDG